MPIYEYRCTGCGADFERLVRSGTKVTCPTCQGSQLERLLSAPAPHGGGRKEADFSKLGPPSGGGCHGGGCGCH